MGYPTSVNSFTTKNTGNTIQAAHINDLQTEVTAIETDLLTAFPSGAAPSGAGGPFDWTPALTFATPGDVAVNYSVQIGKGTKVGTRVTLSCTITTSTFTHTTASGALIITGNPYTATNSSGLTQVGPCLWQGITKANYANVSASIAANASNIQLAISGSGQSIAVVSTGDMPTGGTVSLAFELTFVV